MSAAFECDSSDIPGPKLCALAVPEKLLGIGVALVTQCGWQVMMHVMMQVMMAQ